MVTASKAIRANIMKPNQTRVLLTVIGIASVFTCLTASSIAAETANAFDLVDNLPIAGLPTGPYSAWSTDDREQAHKLIVLGCARTAIAFMQRIYQEGAPKDRMAEESNTFDLACIAMHLPEDPPERAKLQSEAMQHYQLARTLGSELPPSTFSLH
jgi:hypothetical protein